jgi:hypothetical protein
VCSVRSLPDDVGRSDVTALDVGALRPAYTDHT